MRFRTSRVVREGSRRSFRGWRRALVATIVLFVAFALVTARLFIWPAQGMPAHVSAIVVLAGHADRLTVALRLAQERRAPVMVVSQGWKGYGGSCPPAMPDVKVICFDPNPGDTRGEAEFAARLAIRDHWSSVVLVTSPGQDTRARIIMGRCFGGPVYVVTASLPFDQWPYEIAYGWGALIKALVVHRACLDRVPGRGSGSAEPRDRTTGQDRSSASGQQAGTNVGRITTRSSALMYRQALQRRTRCRGCGT
jgi:uncharacterized SAM-binding protein YcdF (DUF218 family)